MINDYLDSNGSSKHYIKSRGFTKTSTVKKYHRIC